MAEDDEPGSAGAAGAGDELPLFVLGTVLFPEGRLPLQVFEPRYLDMVTACLRAGTPFGVVALMRGGEVRARRAGDAPDRVEFAAIGTLAHLDGVDADRPGLLRIECRGGTRFRIQARRERADGLWMATATALAPDPTVAPPSDLAPAARALATTIATLKARHGVEVARQFPSPYRFDDAGWVANRWCELLPLPLPLRQRLLTLDDPVERLRQVDALMHASSPDEDAEAP